MYVTSLAISITIIRLVLICFTWAFIPIMLTTLNVPLHQKTSLKKLTIPIVTIISVNSPWPHTQVPTLFGQFSHFNIFHLQLLYFHGHFISKFFFSLFPFFGFMCVRKLTFSFKSSTISYVCFLLYFFSFLVWNFC